MAPALRGFKLIKSIFRHVECLEARNLHFLFLAFLRTNYPFANLKKPYMAFIGLKKKKKNSSRPYEYKLSRIN
jgi:hypothetical protein